MQRGESNPVRYIVTSVNYDCRASRRCYIVFLVRYRYCISHCCPNVSSRLLSLRLYHTSYTIVRAFSALSCMPPVSLPRAEFTPSLYVKELFVTTLSRWTLQIYAPHETLMQILYPLLHTQCLQGFQKNDFLKSAPRLSKSRLQIFFQLFLIFEE